MYPPPQTEFQKPGAPGGTSMAATGYPIPPPYPTSHPSRWSTGLCDCCSDVSNCCITCWCPCITFGQISEIADRGTSSCIANGALYTLISLVTGCGCLYSCFYRSKMRRDYGLAETPCNDCLVHFCCEACALCQEYRELKGRGFHMSLGWRGNAERQNWGGVSPAPTAPVPQQAMYR